MKNIARLLALLLLLQSCNVYDAPTSAEAAVASDKKVKVITTDKQKYRFERLKNIDNRLTGIAPRGSSTALKLAGQPAKADGENLQIDLSGLDIEKIKLHNATGSTVVTLALIGISAYLALFTIYVTAIPVMP